MNAESAGSAENAAGAVSAGGAESAVDGSAGGVASAGRTGRVKRNVAARVWGRVLAFTADREDATSLALCRIVVSATLACHVAHMLLSGAASFAWTEVSAGGIGTHPNVFEVLGGATATNSTVACALCIVASLCALAGWMTRPALIVAWLTFRALFEIAADARSAYDSLLANVLFVLILSGCGRALSVDALRARRGDDFRNVARWPRMLLVLQMGLLYGGSAMMKASSGWVPGGDASALWFILHQPMWARFGALPSWSFPLTQIATTLTWCFEVLGPVFVLAVVAKEAPAWWFARSLLGRALTRIRFREIYLVAGVVMHLGIELTMEVGAFTGASLALYAAAVRPDEWRAWFVRVRGRALKTRGSS